MTDEAYKFLNAPRDLSRRIAGKKRQREELRAGLLPAAIRYDKDRVQASPRNHTEEAFCRIDQLDREIRDLQGELKKAQQAIRRAASHLRSRDERDVLVRRYALLWTEERIAASMGCSVRWVQKTREKGVRNLDFTGKIGS